jgi:hypothetical protein
MKHQNTISKQSWIIWWFIVSAPGVVLFTGLYSIAIVTGARFQWYWAQDGGIHSAGVDYLLAQPIQSILWTHIQPPLLNTIYLIAYQFGDYASLLTQLFYFFLVALTVALIPITLRLVGISRSMSMISGIIFALLPATTLYSLWPYSTSIVSLLAVCSIFGVALMSRRPRLGLFVSFSAMFLLFLTRPTFNWVFVLAWVIALSIYAFKRWGLNLRFVILTAFGFIIVTFLIQGHYLLSFGTPTLSTWASENLSRSIVFKGLTAEGRQTLANQDPCFSDLINTGVWKPPSAYPNCVDEVIPPKENVLVWDEPDLPKRENNLNYGGRLPLSDKWAALDLAALRLDPLSVPRFVFGSDFSSGTLGIYLSPPEDHPYPLRNFSELPALWSPLRYISLVLPIISWFIIILSAITLSIRKFRPTNLPTLGTYFFGISALLAHGAVSILGDFGENMRFRGELDGVLIIVAATGASILLKWRDQSREKLITS